MRFLLVVAMLEEIEPIREKLNPYLVDKFGHVTIEKGSYKGHEVYLVESGIGKVNASMGITVGLERYKPDVVLNYGVVGSLYNHIQVGDVIVPNDYVYSDADDTAFGSPLGRVPRIPNTYTLHEGLKAVVSQLTGSGANIKTGQVVTSDTFVYKEEQVQFIRDNFPDGIINDMESTAMAQVAYTYNIPFISVKTISDHADGGSTDSYNQEKDKVAKDAVSVLFEAMELIIRG